ncbi:DUF885 domain-containing protein [Corallincola holothuriorum]|uniref:DUF885 domain-containing protein n=1 Tax=Corallincola holothuriorum TaxID=2282215 RepID=A0A368NFS1_9GAMM|nr:DUF885 domain-containing protein [Corallincola holothuriorum]RCU49412.1 DUF885 domain-containing protein [Corallincola holothuriorum]
MQRIIFIIAFVLFLSGCEPKSDITVQSAKSADQAVTTLVDGYLDEVLALDPLYAPFMGEYQYNGVLGNDLTDAYLHARHELNASYEEKAEAIPRDKLSAARKLTLDIFLYDRQVDLADETFPQRFMPINQFYSRYSTFVQLGSGESAQPFTTEKDYRDFMARMAGFELWVDDVIVRMREGAESRVVLPKILVERMLEQISSQLVTDIDTSTFVQPLKQLPSSLSEEQQQQLQADYRKAISELVIPSFTKLYRFLNDEYLMLARGSDGMWDLPNGATWYQHLANRHTTTEMPVEKIHHIGLGEVARIRNEMEAVRQRVGFTGDLSAFLQHLASDPSYFFSDKSQLIAGYSGLKAQINAVLPAYFDVMPKTDYEVRPVEAFREQSAAGASYEPGSPDGSRPGVFYINTYNLQAQPKWGMTTLSLHEAAPGHHFQITIQQELDDLPAYQRFSSATAFVEGWALYAEYLGMEMGLFKDPYQYFGKLSDEMLRAMRLVVDTGLHAKGWSREQAIQYMLDNSAMAKSDVVAEVERYMAIPGQALSYKIGQLKIIELREKAEAALGERFELREFHNQVLLDGSLPLAVLEEKVDNWINSFS